MIRLRCASTKKSLDNGNNLLSSAGVTFCSDAVSVWLYASEVVEASIVGGLVVFCEMISKNENLLSNEHLLRIHPNISQLWITILIGL